MKIDLLETPTEEVRLEIVPLIDVIFCILTFFILAAVGLTRYQAIDLKLPSAQTGQPLPSQTSPGGLSNRLYVSVDGSGRYYVGQQPMALPLLEESMRLHQQYFPDGLVVLYASRDAYYENVIQVLDLARRLGLEVSLATLPQDTDTPQTTSPFEGIPGLDPNVPSSNNSDLLSPSNPSLPNDLEGTDDPFNTPSGDSNDNSSQTTPFNAVPDGQ